MPSSCDGVAQLSGDLLIETPYLISLVRFGARMHRLIAAPHWVISKWLVTSNDRSLHIQIMARLLKHCRAASSVPLITTYPTIILPSHVSISSENQKGTMAKVASFTKRFIHAERVRQKRQKKLCELLKKLKNSFWCIFLMLWRRWIQ